MAQQIINNGSFDNDPSAEKIRTAFDKTNDNFTEVYNSKLDKVETVTTEKQFYVKNADGTQAMANESDIIPTNNDIYYRKIHWWATGGNTATSLEQQGAFLNHTLQYLGSKQNPSTVTYSVNRLKSTPRLVYRSDATAGATSGMYTGRSSVYTFGFIYPFTIVMRFDTSDLASASKSVMSAGLYSSSGGIGAVNPSTLIDCILLANDATDTNLHIIHNDNTGTASKIDLGSDFLANQSNQYYELILDYDGTSVTYKVRRWDNSNLTNTPTAEASGVISTDLPTAKAIKWIVERTNYDVAEAVEIAVSNVELYLRY